MKRLTVRNQHGEAYYPVCFEKCNGEGCSSKCDTCEFNYDVCEELAMYEDSRESGTEMNELLQTVREYACDRCRYPKECRTQEELDTECEICGLSELIRKVEIEYTSINRFDVSQAGRIMKKYKNIVLCEECEYMAENEHGRFCRMADGMTRWLKAEDGCSCGRKTERAFEKGEDKQ